MDQALDQNKRPGANLINKSWRKQKKDTPYKKVCYEFANYLIL